MRLRHLRPHGLLGPRRMSLVRSDEYRRVESKKGHGEHGSLFYFSDFLPHHHYSLATELDSLLVDYCKSSYDWNGGSDFASCY